MRVLALQAVLTEPPPFMPPSWPADKESAYAMLVEAEGVAPPQYAPDED